MDGNRSYLPALLLLALSYAENIQAAVGVSGELSAAYRLTQPSEGDDTRQQIYTARVQAGSYLWRPWFGQWSGDLGLSHVISENNDKSTNDVITGNGSIDLFHRSRFPLRLYTSVQDSSVDTESTTVTDSDFRFERYGIIQNYQPVSGSSKYITQLEHNKLDDSGGGNGETTDFFRFNSTHRYKVHQFANTLTLRDTNRPDNGDELTTISLNVNHGYNPSSNFTLNTTLNYNSQDQSSDLVADRTREEARAISNLFWRDSSRPLTATATADITNRKNETDDTEFDENDTTYRLTGGMRYEFNAALQGNADVGYTSNSQNGDTTSFQTLALNYTPNSIALGSVFYNWSTGGLIRNDTGDEEGDQQTLGGTFSHSLDQTRPLSLNGILQFSWDLAQSLDSNYITNEANRTILTHRGSTTLRYTGVGSYSNLRASIQDDRNYAEIDVEIQSFNLTGSHQRSLTRYSSWQLNFNLGTTRTVTDQISNTFRFSAADVSYTNNRLFGVRDMYFDSELRVDSQDSLVPFSSGNDDTRLNWENELKYRIGLLNLRMTTNVSRSSLGETNKSYYIKVTRLF